MQNSYSALWFEVFSHATPESVQREVRFIEEHLPRRRFGSILDVCCGWGRHSLLLADRGHSVLGIDSSAIAIQRARSEGGSARFEQRDMRTLGEIESMFDAVISMWQSFGYFDDKANQAMLQAMADRLRTGGCLLMDIYDRRFFETHAGTQDLLVGGRSVRETKEVRDGRLHVLLEYDAEGRSDEFEWQVFTPDEINAAATIAGLRAILQCTGFDPADPPVGRSPRMQILFERVR